MTQKLITIDGPSASGKSSVSRLVSKELGWKWVSTGAFYRGLALASIQAQVDAEDEVGLENLAASQSWKVEMAEFTQVFLGEKDVTEEINGENVGAVASTISQIPGVRKALLQRQRNCFDPQVGLVAEGRDCGTVVFPSASAKIYLTANPQLRALRRSSEQGENLEKTLQQQIQRDERDSQRKIAPTKVADGALTIDSSFLSLEEVVGEVIKYSKSQGISV